jgi:hypothetical protein
MPHTIVYDSELHIIKTTFLGIIDIKSAKEITTEFALMGKEKNCYLFLNDFREATLKLSTLDIYEAPKTISGIFSLAGFTAYQTKRALVVSQKSADFQFFETVIHNQGQRSKVFEDIDEAKKWLLEK